MGRLHKAAGLGLYGLLTAVQGVGGMGKTALAIQYAYAYADFYPGGRWLILCARCTSIASAIRSLDSALNIQFTDEEKRDDTRAATRVLSVLEERAKLGAAARAGGEASAGTTCLADLRQRGRPGPAPATSHRPALREKSGSTSSPPPVSTLPSLDWTRNGSAIWRWMSCLRKTGCG